MKTTAVVAALLASAAMAQPHHGRHVHQKKDLDKRKYETEWVTHTEWATLYIDEDGSTLQGPSPAQFYPSTTSEKTTSTTSPSESSSTDEPTTTSEPTPEHTSTPPEPTTSTTEAAPTKEEPTTSQAPVYTPTTSETPQPTSSSGSGGSGGGGSSYSGDITLYDLVGYGACGNNLVGMAPSASSTSDPAVVALAIDRFTAANPNNDPLCGKLIKITAGGVTGYGIVQDKCAACKYDDIDINPEAFAHFMPTSVGRSAVTWEFI